MSPKSKTRFPRSGTTPSRHGRERVAFTYFVLSSHACVLQHLIKLQNKQTVKHVERNARQAERNTDPAVQHRIAENGEERHRRRNEADDRHKYGSLIRTMPVSIALFALFSIFMTFAS